MTRRIPILPTAVVMIAVGIMIALGFWQLSRKAEKEALLARFTEARTMSAEVSWPIESASQINALYRRSRVDCGQVTSIGAVAGRSVDGRRGWAQIARCRQTNGSQAAVALGWSPQPQPVRWSGGAVAGFVGPAGQDSIRLIAQPPQAGLAQLAAPDPANLPNNHLSYAVQWFAFALTALVIYGLALRKRRGTDLES